MIEDILKKISIPNLALGIIIGLAIGYAAGKRSTTQTIGTQTADIATQLRQLNQSLDEIKLKLDIPSLSPPIHGQINGQLPPNMKPVMENEENFELKLNEKGRMIGFVNHRKLFSAKDEE